jgi:RNA-directed DNA polymerase
VSDPPSHRSGPADSGDGGNSDVADRLRGYSRRLRARGVEPVFTLGHLAHLTGARSRYLHEVVNRDRDPYIAISREKRDGTTRPIFSPEPVLMDVQRWLLYHVLVGCDVHHASWAYQRGRSASLCASMHVGARWMVKLDLHDFFDSIHEAAVFRILHSLGYPRLLSFEMARLCTRMFELPLLRRRGTGPYVGVPKGRLPQGAPTSGALANAAMYSVDAELDEIARSHSLLYTRYSDDLTFSTSGRFSRREASRLIHEVTAALESNDLRVHRRKTCVVPPGARKVVLGLLVLEDRVALPGAFKRQLEVHVRWVAMFGLVQHTRHRGFASVLSMVEHVEGCIAFAGSVDQAFGQRIRERWEEALALSGFPNQPRPPERAT